MIKAINEKKLLKNEYLLGEYYSKNNQEIFPTILEWYIAKNVIRYQDGYTCKDILKDFIKNNKHCISIGHLSTLNKILTDDEIINKMKHVGDGSYLNLCLKLFNHDIWLYMDNDIDRPIFNSIDEQIKWIKEEGFETIFLQLDYYIYKKLTAKQYYKAISKMEKLGYTSDMIIGKLNDSIPVGVMYRFEEINGRLYIYDYMYRYPIADKVINKLNIKISNYNNIIDYIYKE